MQLIINIVFLVVLAITFLGFWGLYLHLWKPKKLWPAWLGYILVVAGWFCAVRYYFLYQVDLYGTPWYEWLNLFRTESYGVVFAIFLCIPVFIVLALIYALVNRISHKVPVEERTGRRAFFRTVGTLVPLAAMGGAGYAAYEGQREIVVTHESFGYTNLPPGLVDYKIVQLSDIHIGPSIDLDDFDEILRLALLEHPNRVVITGDLIDKIQWLPEVCDRLKVFAKQIPDGVDYILGNHEFHHDVNKIVDDIKTKTPLNVLINDNIQIMGGKQPVYIAGVSYDNERRKENREAMIDKALSGIPNNAFVILLAHHPEFFDEAIERNVPLTLSGHTHGGQIIFLGMPWVPIGTPYVKGRYTEKNSVCYVNNGSGHWFPIRINCPREITVITFFDGVA
ncbi:metallophosphoesterase [Veillonella atypica]|uniref:metallophosphoesterase n=1 Tax=Veillonella atypica TaxID=39777 RepID=UPI0019615E42|nr:metallophosphoesterase [Veillonella atypica]VTY44797.1 3',5'-cyclic adenosine monophosphate phosphodiesterase CpdA [Veillonella atypica]